MRIAPIAMMGLASLALISCTAAIAPVKINAGDQCFRCRRIIADTRNHRILETAFRPMTEASWG